MKFTILAAKAAAVCLLGLMSSGALLSQDAAAPTQKGLQLTNEGRYREAEEHLLLALEIAGPTNPTVVYNLASLYQRQGRFQEAERLHWLALKQLERVRGPFAPELAQSLNDLGGLYRSLGRYSQAIEVLERASDILNRNPPQKFACAVLNTLGIVYFDIGQYARANALFRRAVDMAESGDCEDPSTLGYIMNSLGAEYLRQKQYNDAKAAFQKAVLIFADTLGSQHPEYGLALSNLALVYQRQGQFREALPVLDAAIEILERSSGRESPVLAGTLHCYAEVINRLGRKSDARKALLRAKSIASPAPGTIDVRALSVRKDNYR